MNKASFIVFLILILGIAAGVVWYLVNTSKATFGQQEPVLVTSPALSDSKAIYTNGIYGFTVLYPEASTVNYEFSSAYLLQPTWRANADSKDNGKAVVEIVPYSTESDHSYPRNYAVLVRIGASDQKDAVDSCLTATKDRGETALSDSTINGTTFKVFSFQNAGMMKYVEGVSYRTLHEGQCIALEKIRTGSSYKDDPESPDDIAQETLDAAYAGLDEIVSSFRFAR
ncbi:hypothetical protein KKD81_01695 [Patescibacteria group bacterium]|nr:hypothetical protein [Patescibacteria group bacterium]